MVPESNVKYNHFGSDFLILGHTGAPALAWAKGTKILVYLTIFALPL